MKMVNGWRINVTASLKGISLPNMTKHHADNLHEHIAEALRTYLIDECDYDDVTLAIQQRSTNWQVDP